MGHARFPDRAATGVVEVRSDLDGLDRGGFWAVVVTFEGAVTCVRFASVTRSTAPPAGGAGRPLARGRVGLAQLLDERAYRAGVGDIRDRIAAGEVYQVNLCRVLEHDAAGRRAARRPRRTLLAEGNPAPYAGLVDVPEAGLEVVSASPELFLRRDGDRVESRPDQGHRGRRAGECWPRTTPRTS